MVAVWRALQRWLGLAIPTDPVGPRSISVVALEPTASPVGSVSEPCAPVFEPPAIVDASAPRPTCDFRLAARLSSVAKLNCPQGRKPRIEQRRASNADPAIPSARLGAKRSRATQGDQRILTTCGRWRTAEIVVFPGAYRAPSNEPTVMDLAA